MSFILKVYLKSIFSIQKVTAFCFIPEERLAQKNREENSVEIRQIENTGDSMLNFTWTFVRNKKSNIFYRTTSVTYDSIVLWLCLRIWNNLTNYSVNTITKIHHAGKLREQIGDSCCVHIQHYKDSGACFPWLLRRIERDDIYAGLIRGSSQPSRAEHQLPWAAWCRCVFPQWSNGCCGRNGRWFFVFSSL